MGFKLWVFLGFIVQFSFITGEFFKPFNVSYDGRAMIIDGKRRMLVSGGIHYPRATPEMWPDLISRSKEGGVDVIETYVFWNGHEPVRGEYNFEGRYDIVKFVKQVGSSGLYLFLRIGPYICAEWNFGGFPVWLRDIPGIEFRTDNAPFKEEMHRFVKRIVDLMRENSLFSWQGGPIIMLQIENEYGNIESSFGPKGKDYMKWAANMAVGLGAGVPWVMCKQVDAPEYIIDTCNGYYCDGFKPNSNKKPTIWTENWDGWYTSWGDRVPHRPAEDIAFAVARFFQRGGSFQNYYMYFGGTNFGRTAGGPNYITSYDYDAPIDEYGLLSQPKWGHLRDLHAAIKLCEPALVAADSPQYIKLGPKQEVSWREAPTVLGNPLGIRGDYIFIRRVSLGTLLPFWKAELPNRHAFYKTKTLDDYSFLSFKAHVYGHNVDSNGQHSSIYGSKCSAFLANIDEQKSATVKFHNQVYILPPWSVSILPDCRSTAFNTAKIAAQTSIKRVGHDITSSLNDYIPLKLMVPDQVAYISKTWSFAIEPIGMWSDSNFTYQGILEHLKVTKDLSDYLWYTTRIYISDEDILFWGRNQVSPVLTIDSMRDLVYVFVNGQFTGSAKGKWIKVVQPVDLVQGYNDVSLLSQTVGLQNYGAFLEKDGAGFRGQMKLSGLKNGDLNLTEFMWSYQVGLKGEFLEIYSIEENESTEWTELPRDAIATRFSWYKTHFDAPDGEDPVALDLTTMGKGQVWVNGHHIGRYWTLNAPKDGCQTCDYRGAYDSDKCVTNCGDPTQSWYHVPRSWLQASDNLLVIFEETEKKPFEISISSRYTETICAQVSENHYPPLDSWSQPNLSKGAIFLNHTVPEMHLQCDAGNIISSIKFASYGTPQGRCQKISIGDCHASNSISVVTQACVGKQSCSVSVSNIKFGGDPCHGVVKTLSVEAGCSSSSSVTYLKMK